MGFVGFTASGDSFCEVSSRVTSTTGETTIPVVLFAIAPVAAVVPMSPARANDRNSVLVGRCMQDLPLRDSRA